jgi:hypothetical protein
MFFRARLSFLPHGRRDRKEALARGSVGLASRLIVKRNGQFPNHIYAVTAWDGGELVFRYRKEKSTERRTVCWRGMESKFQFRDASPPPTAWAPSFRRVSGGSLRRRNSSIGLPRPTTARVIPPRRLSIGPNPTEASKPLPTWRGTEISNPFPSSGESGELPYCAAGSSRSRRTPARTAGPSPDRGRRHRARSRFRARSTPVRPASRPWR